MDILIVEDEWLAVQKLTKLIAAADPTSRIAGVTDGIESTVAWLTAHGNGNPTAPDLIFMDIELADGQSFEIFNRVSVTCPVIFTTSYDEHAIESFRVNQFDYLLKPIKPAELESVLRKYQPVAAQPIPAVDVGVLVNDLRRQARQEGFMNQFLVKQGQRLLSVDAAEIAYIYVRAGTTYVRCRDKTDYGVQYSLDALEELLEPTRFFRVNDEFMVELGAVSRVHLSLTGKLTLTLKPGTEGEVLVSRNRVSGFNAWMGR